MPSKSARRELTFVALVAGVGVALTLAIVFMPWYPAALSVVSH